MLDFVRNIHQDKSRDSIVQKGGAVELTGLGLERVELLVNWLVANWEHSEGVIGAWWTCG